MTSEPTIDIAVAVQGRWTAVTLRGDIDLATAPDLEAACGASTGPLAMDMSEVRFIDSSGLRSLLRLRDVNDPLVLVAPSAVVRRLLALTELTDSFRIVDSIDEAEPSG
jgi:anti-anti-sigma factor